MFGKRGVMEGISEGFERCQSFIVLLDIKVVMVVIIECIVVVLNCGMSTTNAAPVRVAVPGAGTWARTVAATDTAKGDDASIGGVIGKLAVGDG